MKKLIALLLAVLMIAGLCACGSTEPEVTEENIPQTTQGAENNETPETTEATEEVTEIIDETVPTEEQKSAFELAQSCVDMTLDDLIALIGEPESADYAPSCLNPGVGEDGNLYYDGFIVYTYREGDTETVQYVEEAE